MGICLLFIEVLFHLTRRKSTVWSLKFFFKWKAEQNYKISNFLVSRWSTWLSRPSQAELLAFSFCQWSKKAEWYPVPSQAYTPDTRWIAETHVGNITRYSKFPDCSNTAYRDLHRACDTACLSRFTQSRNWHFLSLTWRSRKALDNWCYV